jgi:hypothetical protein
MAGNTGDYHRGEMDIHEQARTYHSFLAMYKWGSLTLAAGILFFVLLFAVGVGFIGSAVTAVVVLIVGFLILRDRKKAGH